MTNFWRQKDWVNKGDVRVNDWENVEEVINTIQPDTTLVVTGPFNEDEETGYRVRWTPGTDLTPIGGVMGDEDAQVHYLTEGGEWLEIPAFN